MHCFVLEEVVHCQINGPFLNIAVYSFRTAISSFLIEMYESILSSGFVDYCDRWRTFYEHCERHSETVLLAAGEITSRIRIPYVRKSGFFISFQKYITKEL